MQTYVYGAVIMAFTIVKHFNWCIWQIATQCQLSSIHFQSKAPNKPTNKLLVCPKTAHGRCLVHVSIISMSDWTLH